MLPQASQRLADDHVALGEVLRQIKAALATGDVGVNYAKLDLFWARLAVHIRAEHLHLFPAVINGVINVNAGRSAGPTPDEVRLAVERLRADHDFFMHELARVIGILRDLTKTTDRGVINETMKAVRGSILEIEKRLVIHNELEEDQIYRWVKTILNDRERADLTTRIKAELGNHPPRFSQDTWLNR